MLNILPTSFLDLRVEHKILLDESPGRQLHKHLLLIATFLTIAADSFLSFNKIINDFLKIPLHFININRDFPFAFALQLEDIKLKAGDLAEGQRVPLLERCDLGKSDPQSKP